MTEIRKDPRLYSFWYLATPYTKYAEGLEAAYQLACKAAADVVSAGFPAFSPIAHGHGMSAHGGLHFTDAELWRRIDHPFVHTAHGLIVLEAAGWRESKGVAAEIDDFVAVGKPVAYMPLNATAQQIRAAIALALQPVEA